MLSNAYSYNDGILYLQKDLRKVTEFSNLSFITAVNDVFNYIKPEELEKVLLNFNKMLKLGGAVLIDFSTEYKLTKVLGNEPCFFDDEKVSYIWLNKLKGDKLTMEITYFLLDKKSGLYEKREEKHIQYVHKTCDIEKALIKAELGVAPNNDGTCIRLNFPPLTEERRRETAKDVKKYGEDAKIVVRNARRDMVDDLKKLEKEENLPEDMVKSTQDDIQKLTDKYVGIIDSLVADKEKEVMTV